MAVAPPPDASAFRSSSHRSRKEAAHSAATSPDGSSVRIRSVYHACMEMSRDAFEEVVAEAMDLVPFAFAQLMDNVVIQVRDVPTPDMIESVGLDPARSTLFGLYSGVSLDRRGGGYGNVLPDAIFIFRRPLLAACRTRPELIRQIQLTLLHEIGHHLGFSDAQMRAWEDAFSMIDSGPVV